MKAENPYNHLYGHSESAPMRECHGCTWDKGYAAHECVRPDRDALASLLFRLEKLIVDGNQEEAADAILAEFYQENKKESAT